MIPGPEKSERLRFLDWSTKRGGIDCEVVSLGILMISWRM